MAVVNPNVALPPAPPAIVRAIQQMVRSGDSTQQSHVSFVNATQRMVNLYWINYDGFSMLYLHLQPNASAKVNTYRSHPWTFRDHNTGEHMHVMHRQTFWPQSYHAPDPRNRGRWIECRKQILIHFPMRTLRETCLWQVLDAIVSNVNSSGEAVNETSVIQQNIEKLSLPSTIKTDLKQRSNDLQKFRNETVT